MDRKAQPLAAVDILAFAADRDGLRLLLCQRDRAPFAGRWSLPGGFIGADETAEAAAGRYFSARTDLSGVYMEQLYTFSAIDRDPRSRVISIAYLALASVSKLAEAARTGPCDLYRIAREKDDRLIAPDGTALSPDALAFDHGDMVRVALGRMAGKLEYTDIAFEMLEDKSRFTLAELYEIYRAVCGRDYDLPNFRRSILKRYVAAGRIEPTGEKLRRRGAPAALYGWKPEA